MSRNGAPIFVEMIAEARAYPSAVYQGIRKLPGRCSCPCLKLYQFLIKDLRRRVPRFLVTLAAVPATNKTEHHDVSAEVRSWLPKMIPLIDQGLTTDTGCCLRQ